MIETAGEKSGPTVGEKSGPTAGEKSSANSRQRRRKRLEDVDAGVQDNGTTHTRSDVHRSIQRDQVRHSRSAREVDSLIFDARVTAETQQAQLANKVASQGRTGHSKTTGADGPDSAGKPSSCSSSTRPWRSLSRRSGRPQFI